MTQANFIFMFEQMRRYILRVAKILAGCVAVVILVGLIGLWRLNAHPITSTFLTPYVERGIDRILPHTHTQIAKTIITWDNVDKTISMHAENMLVKDEQNIVLADIPRLDIRLNAFGLLFGQFMPTELMIDHPQIRLGRGDDGMLYFGSKITEEDEDTDIRLALLRVVDNLAHAMITRKLEIKRAVLDVYEKNGKNNWSISVPEITLDRSKGDLTGDAKVELTQRKTVATLKVRYTYDSRKELHRLATGLDNITPSLFAGGHPETVGLDTASIIDLPLTGNIELAVDNDLDLHELKFDVEGGEGYLRFVDLWDKPRKIKNMNLKAEYAEGTLSSSAIIVDFDGPKANISLTGKNSIMPDHDFDFDLTANISNWPMDQYPDLWPKPVIPNARAWVAGNLSRGMFDKGTGTFKGQLSWDDLGNIKMLEGNGKVWASKGRVNYLDEMPQVEGVNGYGVFNLKEMTVDVSGGGIGALRVKPFTLKMTGLDENLQFIEIPLKVRGPLYDVLKLINQPRLGYASAVGLTPEDVSGMADATVNMRLPMLKAVLMKDIEVSANAELTNLASSKLLKSIDISQGDMRMDLDKTGFSLKGAAALNKVPFRITWLQDFKEQEGKPLRQATVTGTVAGNQWAVLGIDALDGTRGPVGVNVHMIETKGVVTVSGDLDMTAAEVEVGPLNWKKQAKEKASVTFKADMPKDQNITVRSVEAQGPNLNIKGDGVLTKDGKPIILNINPMIVGRTNAALHFADDEKTGLKFSAEGEVLDLSGLKSSGEPGKSDPRPKEFRINLGKLYLGTTGYLTKAEGYAIRDQEGWSEISLRAFANGEHKLTMDLAPKNGRRYFAIATDDFGQAMRGLGFTDTVSKGKVDIRGESSEDNPRTIEGEAKIGAFTVKDLPALVVLLNATSPFGIPNLIEGTMDFSHLEGKFKWHGDVVEVNDMNAAGSSTGISVHGTVDMNSGEAKLDGMVAPFSVVNDVIGSIPLIGDLITGGDGGGVVSVAYSIRGTLNKPDVSVNPASLLTPGFLRRLFFGGGESEDQSAPMPKLGKDPG